MKNTEEHVGKMETQLQHWGAKLDEVMANLDAADAEADIDYHNQVDALKKKYHAFQVNFEEAKAADREKWEHFKVNMEIAWNDLELAFKNLRK